MIRAVIISILSIILCALSGIESIITLLIFFFSSYFIGKYLYNKKYILYIYISLIVLSLFIVKYISKSNFLPLGLSYYSLQIMDYILDLKNKKYRPEKNIFIYAMLILYYPHLFIGPIFEYEDFRANLKRKYHFNYARIVESVWRISIGLAKKYIIAARITIIINNITNNNLQGIFVLLACILYTFELYSDFSGGMDIIIGISKLVGIDLPENFNLPLFAKSFRDFWRRWHITLSNFVKNHIYIPIGGNKKGITITIIATLTTFFLSGAWHGKQYILWGIYNGILAILSRKLTTRSTIINRIIVLLGISFSWIFFIYNTNLEALNKFLTIFNSFSVSDFITNISLIKMPLIEITILTISLMILLIGEYLFRIKEIKINNEIKLSIALSLVLIVLIFGIYGIGFDVNSFIYSKF